MVAAAKGLPADSNYACIDVNGEKSVAIKISGCKSNPHIGSERN
jgi:hypothetical protein